MNDNRDIILLLWSYRKYIIYSMIAAFVVSCAVLLTLPNYYKASALFYPLSEEMQQPIVEPDSDVPLYGGDGDVDRLLSIAKSSATKNELIQALDLYNYYGLDPNNRKDRIKMTKKLDKYYDVQKTEYDAVMISYEDTSRVNSATFANKALQIVDHHTVQIANQSRKTLKKTLDNTVKKKTAQLAQITEQIQSLKTKYKIFDVDHQAEALALLSAKNPNQRSTQKSIADYTAGVSQIKTLEVQQENLSEDLAKDMNTLSAIESVGDLSSAIHIVEHATTPDIKSRPKRSILAVMATLAMGLFVSLAIVVLDTLKSRYAA